jgi:hypothetical protein
MTLFDFSILSDEEQIDVLYKQGVYVGKRAGPKGVAVLYQVNDFYVEVLYRKYRYIVAHISCSSGTALLEPYLGQIDVSEVLGQLKNIEPGT